MRTGVFQHIYKHLVEYLEELWTRRITESRKQEKCFWSGQVEHSLSREKIKVKAKLKVKKYKFHQNE